MPKTPKKLSATYQGATATRRTALAYTHVVFALHSAEAEALRLERDAAHLRAERALVTEALGMIARGETPAKGHALLGVTSANGYHRFTRWDNVARRTDDAGRTFRDLTLAEATARAEQYDTTASEAAYAPRAAAARARGDEWVALSWHRRYDLALKAAGAATGARYPKTAVVAVTPPEVA